MQPEAAPVPESEPEAAVSHEHNPFFKLGVDDRLLVRPPHLAAQ
jgi:hypothetical protein